MWCSDVDLHSHSTHSDGTLDVATLAASMAREGVRVWSLTDHDTTSGWEDAAEQANVHGMAFLQAWNSRVSRRSRPPLTRQGRVHGTCWRIFRHRWTPRKCGRFGRGSPD